MRRNTRNVYYRPRIRDEYPFEFALGVFILLILLIGCTFGILISYSPGYNDPSGYGQSPDGTEVAVTG